MGQVFTPTDIKIEGPWLLDINKLEELSQIINLIEKKLQEDLDIQVDYEAALEYNNLKEQKNDLNYYREKIKKLYPYKHEQNRVILETKEGKRIEDNSLLSLLKDSKVNDYTPNKLEVFIEKGNCRFSLSLTTTFDGELETRTRVSEESIRSDINYELNKWFEGYRPKRIDNMWFKLSTIYIAPVVLGFVIGVTETLNNDPREGYKKVLRSEVESLLKDGLNESEIKRSLEIILQVETGYVPTNTNYPSYSFFMYACVIGFVLSIILFLSPKTVIGVGKSRNKVKLYRIIKRILYVIIPTTIGTIVLNKVSDYL